MHLSKSLLTLVLLLNAPFLFAQDFEGIISYQIDYKDTLLIEGGGYYRTDFPITLEQKFTPNYLKTTWFREDKESTTTIFDYPNNRQSAWGLMMKGVKVMAMSVPDLAQFENIRKLAETENIAGFTCQKYEIADTLKGEAVKHYVWTTKELSLEPYRQQISFMGYFYWFRLPKSLGFPLKLSLQARDTEQVESTIILTATKVEPKKLSLEEFQVRTDLEHIFFPQED